MNRNNQRRCQMVEELFRNHRIRFKDILNWLQYPHLGTFLQSILQFPYSISQVGLHNALLNLLCRFPRLIGIIIYGITVLYVLCCLPENVMNKIPYLGWNLTNGVEWIRWFQVWTKQVQLTIHSDIDTELLHSPTRHLRIGIIPDGNRRWAKENGTSTPEGHLFGSARIVDIVKASILEPDIRQLAIYILTVDNFQKRSLDEQEHLQVILEEWIDEFIFLHQNEFIHLRIIGEPTGTLESILTKRGLVPNTHTNTTPGILEVDLLICYDGQREIQQAQGDPSKLWIRNNLDAVFRSGGTRRMSGFCTYQTNYSEMFFDDRMWPDISVSEFQKILQNIRKSHSRQNYGR